jgi:uncharacterized protein YceH (UPF0502 family)
MHLLSGEPAPEAVSSVAQPRAAESVIAAEIASLKEMVQRLERELAQLRQQVAALSAPRDIER